MTCFYPTDAWRSKFRNEKSGRTPLVFNKRSAEPDTYLQIACGKCEGCQLDKARDWSVRMQHESQLHERNTFVTFTYSDEALPKDQKLRKSDIQNLIKRIRFGGDKLRYFACGEYGGLTRRPHYHAIIFGMDFMSQNQIRISDTEYVSPELSYLWQKGQVVCAPVTPQSCSYVAGYVNKKIGEPDTFSIMSRRPPIGYEWLKKYWRDIDAAKGVVEASGRSVPVPKVYYEWLDGELDYVKDDVRKKINSRSIEEIVDRGRMLRAKEISVKQRINERNARENYDRNRRKK